VAFFKAFIARLRCVDSGGRSGDRAPARLGGRVETVKTAGDFEWSCNKNLTNDSICILRGHKQRKSKVYKIGLELALGNASPEGRFNKG
jgi:hypothetical protein